jgi:hypothetical protein
MWPLVRRCEREWRPLSEVAPTSPTALSDEHPKVSFVLAGSRQHLMESLVLSQGAPLYNMAERLVLGPIEQSVMCKFLVSRTKSAQKVMTIAGADAISEMAGPIPHDIQRLAYEVFDVSTDTITEIDVASGMNRVVAHEPKATPIGSPSWPSATVAS